MNEQTKTTIKDKDFTGIIKICNNLILATIGLYLFFIAISRTHFSINLPDTNFLYPLFFILTAAKLTLIILSTSKDQRDSLIKKILPGLMIFLVWLFSYYSTIYEYENLRIVGILTLACIGIDYKKVIRLYVIIISLVILPTVFCALSGTITNLVYYYNYSYVRSAWGTVYPTDFSSAIVFLCLFSWIAWKKLPDLFFIICGVLSLLLALFITHSNTSVLCSILFIIMVIWNRILLFLKDGKVKNIMKKFNDIATIIALPLFTIVMILGALAYHEGFSFAEKLNEWNHYRLSNASNMFDSVGLSLFGKSFANIGAGGSTIISPNYNFVDCSYLLILLRYGVITLIMIVVLWVLMTKKAIKIGDNRLALGMALIAFHSLSEHHLPEINYNILIVLPLSILLIDSNKESDVKEYSTRKYPIIYFATCIILSIATLPLLLKLSSLLRTTNNIKQLSSGGLKTIILYVGSCLGLCAIIALVVIISHFSALLFNSKEAIKNNQNTRLIIIAIISFICICVEIVSMKLIINNASSEKQNILKSDQKTISIIDSVDTCKLYVDDYPELYKKEYKNIKTGFLCGEDLARCKNVALITDVNKEYPALIYNDFMYTEISEKHALYTNSDATIEELQKNGFILTNYYSHIAEISQDEIAECNETSLLQDNSIEITKKTPVKKGPYIDLTEGCYEVSFDISLPSNDISYNPDEAICYIVIMSWYDQDDILEQKITRSMFDNEENLSITLNFDFETSTAGVNFSLYAPVKDTPIFLHGIKYRKISVFTSSHDNSVQY